MMQKIYNYFKEKREKGQSVIEYALLIGVVAGAVFFLASDTSFSTKISTLWNGMSANIPDKVADKTTSTTSTTTPSEP